MIEEQEVTNDPLAKYGSNQRYALVWFFGILIIGGGLTYVLSNIDEHLYKTDGQVLNYDKYKENREALSSIKSETQDLRADGDYVTTIKQLEN